MSRDPNPAAAAVLAGSMQVAPLDPAEILERLRVPAVHRVVPRTPPPLDLDAAIFRYRIEADDRISALRGIGRLCRGAHRHRR
jgi:hypothetical protein